MGETEILKTSQFLGTCPIDKLIFWNFESCLISGHKRIYPSSVAYRDPNATLTRTDTWSA